MIVKSLSHKLLDSMRHNSQEALPYFKLFGYILLISFPGFYFLNSFFFEPQAYENFYLRILIGFFGASLIFYKYWPKYIFKWMHLIFYFILLISLPFFFIFMLLSNPTSNIWHINGLIGLVVLSFFVDWISFTILSLLGAFLAWLVIPNYMFNPILIGVFGSYSAPIIYFIIFSHKKKLAQEKLEQKVQERTIELQKALSAKTEFLNNMSHEVRTPIQGFTTISEGLVEHWQDFDDKKRLSLAKTVASNAQRLASLVTNLLDLSKFTANKMILDIKANNLVDIIEDIIEECKELYLNKKTVKIHFIKPDSAILAKVDGERIAQVLRNLFANAIKFSKDNGLIIASIIRIDNKWHFSITDEGVGIPEDELEDIFDPFTQSSRTRSGAGGTGLGLSICKQIITAHNGEIWATNNQDIGASFHFLIPAEEQEKSSSKTIKNILMIDDEESCLTSMEILLMDGPYTLFKASNAKECLKILYREAKIDAILLDLMMPDIYGLDLLKEIRKDHKFANIPVILQSGTSDESQISAAMNMGIIAFIKKPYSKQTVIDALNLASSI